MITPLSDDNRRTIDVPNSTTQMTKKQKKALAVVEQKELNLESTKATSKSLLSYDASNVVLATAPEIKSFVKATVNHDYTIGSYVEVFEYYSRGFNCPFSCGYIK